MVQILGHTSGTLHPGLQVPPKNRQSPLVFGFQLLGRYDVLRSETEKMKRSKKERERIG